VSLLSSATQTRNLSNKREKKSKGPRLLQTDTGGERERERERESERDTHREIPLCVWFLVVLL
jgi:hypothetical protein